MKKIIVIDNNNVLTVLLEELFEENFELIMTRNVGETAQILGRENNEIDLIISDYNIQIGETAEELFTNLRSSGHDKIPVLIYSGYNEDRLPVESHGGMFVLIPDEYHVLEKVAEEMG
jgi:DNA-binding NtrC family response regulator